MRPGTSSRKKSVSHTFKRASARRTFGGLLLVPVLVASFSLIAPAPNSSLAQAAKNAEIPLQLQGETIRTSPLRLNLPARKLKVGEIQAAAQDAWDAISARYPGLAQACALARASRNLPPTIVVKVLNHADFERVETEPSSMAGTPGKSAVKVEDGPALCINVDGRLNEGDLLLGLCRMATEYLFLSDHNVFGPSDAHELLQAAMALDLMGVDLRTAADTGKSRMPDYSRVPTYDCFLYFLSQWGVQPVVIALEHGDTGPIRDVYDRRFGKGAFAALPDAPHPFALMLDQARAAGLNPDNIRAHAERMADLLGIPKSKP